MLFIPGLNSKRDSIDLNRVPSASKYLIQPNPDEDAVEIAEIEIQRFKWSAFIKSRKDIWSEDWLWQSRRKNQTSQRVLKKKLLQIFSSRIKAQKTLKELIRAGVPPELRKKVWWACSGAEQKMKAASPAEQYAALLGRVGELSDTTIQVDIEKDLNRTLPERINNETDPKFIDSLRNILSAYALRNTAVGYCQSMNYLCAVLLCNLADEERTFWMLCALIEDILPPDYYTPSLIGGRVDQQVFQSCIAAKLPRLFAAFKATHTMLEPIICPWFLCLYINVLPLHTVCRVWDCLFWEGNMVLFRVGLTMMKSKMGELLEAPDFISVYTILKTSTNKEHSFELETHGTGELLNQLNSGHTGTQVSSVLIRAHSTSPSPMLGGGFGLSHSSGPSTPTHGVETAAGAGAGAGAGQQGKWTPGTAEKRGSLETPRTSAATCSFSTTAGAEIAGLSPSSGNAGGGVGGSGSGKHDGSSEDRESSISCRSSSGLDTGTGTGTGNSAASISPPVASSREMISQSEHLMRSAFGFRWLRAVPAHKVEELRRKFHRLLVSSESSHGNRSRLASDASSAGGAAGGGVGGGGRGTKKRVSKISRGVRFVESGGDGTDGVAAPPDSSPAASPGSGRLRRKTSSKRGSAIGSAVGGSPSSSLLKKAVGTGANASEVGELDNSEQQTIVGTTGIVRGLEGTKHGVGEGGASEIEDEENEDDDDEEYDDEEEEEQEEQEEQESDVKGRRRSDFRTRKSTIMLKVLQEHDLELLMQLAQEMDEGLGSQVEALALELDGKSSGQSQGGAESDRPSSLGSSSSRGGSGSAGGRSSADLNTVSSGNAFTKQTSSNSLNSLCYNADSGEEDEEGDSDDEA